MSTAELAIPEPTGVDWTNAVEIDWYDENDRVIVRPRNEKRFTIQKDAAIKVLRLASEAARFTMQFDLLLETLAAWVKERGADVSRAIVTLQDNSLVFVVMRSDPVYNEQFQDALSELDFRIAQDACLDLIRLQTLLLPPVDAEAVGSFLDPRMILTYQHHGK